MTYKEPPKVRPLPGNLWSAQNSRRERRHLVVMCFGVTAAAALIAATAFLALEFRTTPARLAASAQSSVASNVTGTIMLHPGAKECRTFDNRTGQISQTTTSCPAVSADGPQIPLGTAHTLSAISKSFK
jgi:hypothetical protein